MIAETVKILRRELPMIPLHQQVSVWAMKQSVGLVQPADHYFPYRYARMK